MNNINKIRYLLSEDQQYSFILLFIFMIIGTFLETLSIGLIIPAVSLLLEPQRISEYEYLEEYFFNTIDFSSNNFVLVGMIIFLFVYLLKAFFLSFLTYFSANFTFGIQEKLSTRLFRGYLRKSYSYHLENNSAFILQNIVSKVGGFKEVGRVLILLITEILTIFAISILLLWANFQFTVFLLLFLIVITILYVIFTRPIVYSWGKDLQYHDAQRILQLQQGIGSVKDIKITGSEDVFIKKFNTHNFGLSKLGKFQETLVAMPRLWMEPIIIGCIFAVLLISMNQELSSTELITLFALYAAAAFRLMPAIVRIMMGFSKLRHTLPVIEHLFDETKNFEDDLDYKSSEKIILKDSIVFDGVSFIYNGSDKCVLENINLTIKKNEIIGIIGPSGSGKSTLINLITGLLIPSKGKVKIDGHDLKDYISAWQNIIGYVSQNTYLLDDTIRNNIAFGLPPEHIDEEKIDNAIAQSQLSQFIKYSPQGKNTVVGEKGVRISGGQLQRIGIARALYNDPQIIIFDEASSALDIDTENELINAISNLKNNKTILIVSHRQNTLKFCDKIYNLNEL